MAERSAVACVMMKLLACGFVPFPHIARKLPEKVKYLYSYSA
jgi:hypothetical protein